ncbi:MAG: hypothetical protein FGM32_07525 [Candidatus Kapabacteria bacterium]|nr:hypothetical protein [Candidatus Kapabacteria bacterium]
MNFADTTFPASLDLHNACSGVTYANTADARKAIDNSSVITVDTDGEVFSAYIFADNYFEMYVNGVSVGKDNVPYNDDHEPSVMDKSAFHFEQYDSCESHHAASQANNPRNHSEREKPHTELVWGFRDV